jgi:hypothetical protein
MLKILVAGGKTSSCWWLRRGTLQVLHVERLKQLFLLPRRMGDLGSSFRADFLSANIRYIDK